MGTRGSGATRTRLCGAGTSVPADGSTRRSVLRLRGIHLVYPIDDAAPQVLHAIALLAEEVGRLRAPDARLALGHDLHRWFQLAVPLAQLTERDQHGAVDAVDLVFLRLADIEHHEAIAAIEARLQIHRRNLAGIVTGLR